jgi:hypothetical protein
VAGLRTVRHRTWRVVLRGRHIRAGGEDDGSDDGGGDEKAAADHWSSPDVGKRALLEVTRHNVPPSGNAEMAFSYHKMLVSYQKQRFSYHFLSR